MVELKLTDEQARQVMISCEFFTRVRCGQFKEISEFTVNMTGDIDDVIARKNSANEFLMKARAELFPELYSPTQHYGIGKFKDADISYDVYQAIRKVFGDPRTPFTYYEIPECKRYEDTEKKA